MKRVLNEKRYELCDLLGLQANRVKHSPQDYINELI